MRIRKEVIIWDFSLLYMIIICIIEMRIIDEMMRRNYEEKNVLKRSFDSNMRDSQGLYLALYERLTSYEAMIWQCSMHIASCWEKDELSSFSSQFRIQDI